MKILKNQFYDINKLEIINFGTLNFYPPNLILKTPTKIKSLDELFDRNLVRINEIDFDGVVGNVEVSNNSNYLYILDGEAITGAKQNRVAERSVIIAPYSAEIIPVNCVEKGRWGYNSQSFSKVICLHPKAREEKAELKNQQITKFKMPFGIKLMIFQINTAFIVQQLI